MNLFDELFGIIYLTIVTPIMIFLLIIGFIANKLTIGFFIVNKLF